MCTSYVSTKLGVFARFSEAWSLYRMHTARTPRRIARLIHRLDDAAALVRRRTGLRLEHLRMLDIGPGQTMAQMAYFSCSNQVTGIDLDLVPQGIDIRQYWRMLARNGPLRTIKTILRKLLAIDARFRREMARQLGTTLPSRFDVRAMDAADMTFPPSSFDFLYSFSVFEHLADPARVLAHIARVLAPGGVSLISLHPYTSETGCHDPRLLSNRRGSLPYWPHLRPSYRQQVHPNSFLNRLRLPQWRMLFSAHMPNVEFVCRQPHREKLARRLETIRAGGELLDYDTEELLTGEFMAIWQKPAKTIPPRANPMRIAPPDVDPPMRLAA